MGFRRSKVRILSPRPQHHAGKGLHAIHWSAPDRHEVLDRIAIDSRDVVPGAFLEQRMHQFQEVFVVVGELPCRPVLRCAPSDRALTTTRSCWLGASSSPPVTTPISHTATVIAPK